MPIEHTAREVATGDSPRDTSPGGVAVPGLCPGLRVEGLAAEEPRVVRLIRGGPALVEGPVRIVAEDGDEVESDRFVVAICRCRRSERYPLCDTSHRRPRRDPR
ncbi:hypothetical protein Rruber_03428 [Rhodococcus ruber]